MAIGRHQEKYIHWCISAERDLSCDSAAIRALEHRLTDHMRFTEVGKSIGQHSVSHQPSIGKLDPTTSLQEPKARESILSPAQRARSSSSPCPPSTSSNSTSSIADVSMATSTTTVASTAMPTLPLLVPDVLRIASEAINERPRFSIDDAASDDSDEEDGSEDEESIGEEDDDLFK